MEESFKVRVDKIFGSLASSPSSSAATETTPSSSLWSLTDDEIERREWVRDKTIPESELEPVFGNHGKGSAKKMSPVDLKDELEKDLEDLDDDDVEEEDEPRRRQSNKPDDYDEEQWNIKSGIGQDCTLDYEVWFFFFCSFSVCCTNVLICTVTTFSLCENPIRSFRWIKLLSIFYFFIFIFYR
jgi:hypothetical protein